MEKKRILIIDDDDGMRAAIRRLLSFEDQYDIEEAANGVIAEEQIKKSVPDLIVLDIRMPEKDGYEVCFNLRKNKKFNHVKIVAVSGFAGHIGDAIITALGADCFFEKPFDNERFKKTVDDLLRKVN